MSACKSTKAYCFYILLPRKRECTVLMGPFHHQWRLIDNSELFSKGLVVDFSSSSSPKFICSLFGLCKDLLFDVLFVLLPFFRCMQSLEDLCG